jgi:insulysin
MIHLVRFLIGVGSGALATIRKAHIDHREYRHIVLPNQLEAVIISDPSTNTAAAALEIAVGSMFDPPEHNGLAHFVEHMLGMGSTKYPNEDEYKSYLAKHGGTSNAMTALSRTSYFFSVQTAFFERALDIFGQFFI